MVTLYKKKGDGGFRANRFTTYMVFPSELQGTVVGFIDLTKAFDLVSRDGLFKILPKIGFPPRLLNMIRSFHEEMKGWLNIRSL